MGQQQLLLVILVTIIVGIATVVAINIFGSSAEQANEDAVRQDIVTIAAAAQGWYIKPSMLGGGGNSFEYLDFTKFAFSCTSFGVEGEGEGQTENPEECENVNATYTISSAGSDQFRVTAVPSTYPNVLVADITRNGITWVNDNE